MALSTSTGSLAVGASRTFNLSPGSALTLTTLPNCRVTVTETPNTVDASGVGGNASRVHNLQLGQTVTYGPYPMGGTVVVANASNSGGAITWVRSNALAAEDSATGVRYFVDAAGNRFGSSLIYQSAVPITAPADLNNNVLLSVTIPPLQANSRIRATMMWSRTNNANAHRIKCRFGGSAYFYDAGIGSVASGIIPVDIINRGATNSQIGTPINVNTTQNFGTGVQTTSAIDTSTSQLLTFECAKVTTAADSVVLEGAWVEVFW